MNVAFHPPSLGATVNRPARRRWAVAAVALAVLVLSVATPSHAAQKAGDKPDDERPAAADSADGAGSADDSFDGLVTTAWQALAKRDVPAAKAAIADAVKKADDAGQKKEATQMVLLAASIEQFWRAVDAELKRLQPGDELDLNDVKAAVVEAKADSLTLHVEGKNQKKTRAALSGKWALAVAEHRLDNSPANKRILGAFWAVDPQGDRRQARKLWEAAQRGEPAVSELLALLDNSNIPAAADDNAMADDDADKAAPGEAGQGEPVEVPSKDKLTAAGKHLKETYGADIRGAKTPEQKLELSQTLVAAAADGDDPALRLALLRQAADLAATAGDTAAMDKVVAKMQKRFKIDVWEVKAEALTRAAAGAKSASIADVVRRSLELLSEWDNEEDAKAKKGHAKAAQKLDQAALLAAQRAHDPDLVSTVVDRKKQAHGDAKD